MARHKYGRSRMNRRRPRRNRWRYVVGILLLVLIFYLAFKGRGTNSESPSVASDNPAASNTTVADGTPATTAPDEVISATELSGPETTFPATPPAPQVTPSASALPAFDPPPVT
ncbi:hypothetical protein ACFL6U_08075, partial [Planctomycetota bacterium]